MRLRVEFETEVVGHAEADDDQRFALRYAQSWLERADAFPISLSLPLRAEIWPAGRAHSYFANLLPEGLARDAISARLGISPDNDVALLRALGNDTAGALRYVVEGDSAQSPRGRTPIAAAELARWAAGEPAILIDSDVPPRLSLAGAQHKASVVITADGLALPGSDEPSTHIVKFDSPRFPHLAANEFITMRFAANLGLDVANAELRRDVDVPILLVERFDRLARGGETRRLHQEDFCQVFAVAPNRKYEGEGGPSLEQIAAKLREASAQPARDRLQLIRWTIFNAIAGNADGHAKNLSLVRAKAGLRLAPAYDLVCTRAFERLDKRLAMSIGGQRDPDRLTRDAWTAFAKMIGVRPRAVFGELERMLGDAPDALDAALDAAGDTHAAQYVDRAVRKRLRGVGGNL